MIYQLEVLNAFNLLIKNLSNDEGEVRSMQIQGIKPYLLQMLKELAMLGAMGNRVELSSAELADQIHISQQTASRYLLDMDAMDLIKRELGVKKQLIHITEKGSDVLKDEYLQYKHIFDMPLRIHLEGTIVSGMKEGTYYISQEGYVKQFTQKLGFEPYPGTLNVSIDHIEKNKIRLIKKYEGITIDPFKTAQRTFGGVTCFHATINAVSCVLVLPLRGHYSSILEFIAPVYLREAIGVDDGDTVQIVVSIMEKDDE